MVINKYDSRVFSNLLDFHIVEKLFNGKDFLVEELGSVIIEHNMEKVVGVSLLHKHFELNINEKLVRCFLNNKMKISPKVSFFIEAIPYMWAFSKNGLFPIEFLEESNATSKFSIDVNELYRNRVFLQDFRQKLEKLGLEGIFGLSLIPHSLFSFEEDEVLIETDNISQRVLTISVCKNKDLKKMKSVRTLWTFGKDTKGLDCVVHCIHCAVHC